VSNALLRVLTALVGVPVILGALYLGGWVFGLLVLAAALLSQWELYRMMEQGGLRPLKWAGVVIGLLGGLHALVPQAAALAVACFVLLLALSPFLQGDEQPLASLAGTMLGVLYPTVLLTFLIDLRLAGGLAIEEREAFGLTLLVFVLIWATDTFAYYVGRAVGRRPLAPKVSPKKTWEGAAGGVVGALVAAAVLKVALLDSLPWVHVLGLALVCSVAGQLGDLAESRLKRSVGVKDSGTLLPGHGGLLDRFDALIVVAPLAYLYLAVVL
jgi:phosphatidate cytidylyltransferase